MAWVGIKLSVHFESANTTAEAAARCFQTRRLDADGSGRTTGLDGLLHRTVGRDEYSASRRLGLDQLELGQCGVVGEQPLATAARNHRVDQQRQFVEQAVVKQ